jgi:hypothetical protein
VGLKLPAAVAREELEELQDLRDLRAAKAEEGSAPSVTLAEAKRRYGVK